jgi:hypothetical protein
MTAGPPYDIELTHVFDAPRERVYEAIMIQTNLPNGMACGSRYAETPSSTMPASRGHSDSRWWPRPTHSCGQRSSAGLRRSCPTNCSPAAKAWDGIFGPTPVFVRPGDVLHLRGVDQGSGDRDEGFELAPSFDQAPVEERPPVLVTFRALPRCASRCLSACPRGWRARVGTANCLDNVRLRAPAERSCRRSW